MRSLMFGAALLFATPAFACPMADAAAFAEAAKEVEAMPGAKVTLAVDGMHCGSCSEKVVAALKGIDGVAGVASDYQTGKTVVALSEGAKLDAESLAAAVSKAGFKAAVATDA